MDTLTSASPILTPSSSLTLVNTTPPPGQTTSPTRFILFGEQWLTLQTYITQALQLPINLNDWNEKYGDFSDKKKVDDTLRAMTDVHNLASRFGNPTLLKNKIISDPNYLTTQAPPAEIYGHIVWLANNIENTAGTFKNTFEFLQSMLSPSAGTKEKRAENLKTILTGPGGLQSSADDMKVKTQDLLKKLLQFDEEFSAANTLIQDYSGEKDSILAEAQALVGQLQEDIKRTQAAADDAYEKWRNYTIAAVSTSVGLMILTAGILWPVALGLGVGLGVAAALEMDNYNKLMDKVSGFKEQERKKARLVTDLTGLNKAIGNIAPAMTDFKTSLEQIEGVWNNVSMNLAYIVNNYGPDQLGDLTWVMQTMKILDAQKKWGDISTTAQQFTQNSLVSFDFSTSYGQKLPE